MLAIFHSISVYFILFPALLGMIFFTHLDGNSKLISVMLIAASLSQLAPYTLPSKRAIWMFYNLYIVLDVSFWGIVFFRILQKNRFKFLVLLILAIHIVMSTFVFTAFGLSTRFYNELVCLDSLCQVIWVLMYFLHIYYEEDIQDMESKPMFWYSMGILLYSPTTYFLFAHYTEIKNSGNHSALTFWSLHDIMNMTMYLFFAKAIWLNKYPSASWATKH